MNNAPDNLDIATRDRVDMLVSRIADAEARAEDWAAFNELAERHPWAWRELAQAQRDHAAMCVAVGVALQSADTVFLPVRAGASHAPQHQSRLSNIGAWAGWAVAACLGLAFVGGVRLPINQPAANSAGFNPVANWTPDDYVRGYVSSGEKSGLVLGEVPRRVLIESRPLEQGDGYEVVYVRQFVERAKVSDLVKFATDDTGRAVPVRHVVPGRPIGPE